MPALIARIVLIGVIIPLNIPIALEFVGLLLVFQALRDIWGTLSG